MPTTGQGMSFAEIKQIVAQRVTNAIEAIAIYDTIIRMAHNSIVRIVRQGANVARKANNKRKWEGVGHMTRDSRTLIPATTQRPPVANQKTAVTCYKCGKLGHYRSECSKLKDQNYDNQMGNERKAHGDPNVVADNANA
ncbi:reverse transcriptase domain-containing protein [Tanacetum coccineum]